MKKKIILDALSIAPYYDYYLMKSMEKIDDKCYMFITTFAKDKKFISKINKKVRSVDFIYKTKISDSRLGKAIKVIEYIINLFKISFDVLFNKIEVIHIQWLPLISLVNLKKLELYFLKFWKWKNVKLVYTVHNILPHDTGQKYYKSFFNVYNICDDLICHTKKTSLELQEKFNIQQRKIHIIPHGPLFSIEQKIEKHRARELLALPNKKIVLMLGFLRPYKGIEFLLDTWEEVSNADKKGELLLVIAGEGKEELKKEINKMIDTKKIRDSVLTRFEFIKTEDVPIYHFASDVVVFPYKHIDQSGALYTAMSTEIPIIATNVGGFKEVIEDTKNGLLVEYGDVEAFKNKIIELIYNYELSNKFIKKNSELINGIYSWDEICLQTVEVYNK